MKKKEKTTVSVYFSQRLPFFSLYSFDWLPGSCFVSFYGTNAKAWEEKWQKFRTVKLTEAKAVFEKEKSEKIKKLELELLVAVDSWFKKVRKPLEEKLSKEKERTFTVSEWDEFHWIYEFLPDDCVKISSGDHETIYEILAPLKSSK